MSGSLTDASRIDGFEATASTCTSLLRRDRSPWSSCSTGFPELWYSWRHQLPALADAGYHAVAPDLRGYGETDAPEAVESYGMLNMTADVAWRVPRGEVRGDGQSGPNVVAVRPQCAVRANFGG